MSQAQLFRHVIITLFGLTLLATGLVGSADGQCQLNSPSGKIKHVVYVEFDNVHFTRDNPNVPSDLEQMPNLLNFITQHGTLDAGDHTVLISHTANDILTTQIGLYSDDTGIFIANSFGVFSPTTSGENGLFPSSFFYWTDKVSDITPARTTTPSRLRRLRARTYPRPGCRSLALDVRSAPSPPRTSCWNALPSTSTKFSEGRHLRRNGEQLQPEQ